MLDLARCRVRSVLGLRKFRVLTERQDDEVPAKGVAGSQGASLWRQPMTRFVAVAFALALASTVQAMPRAPLPQTDETIIQVREACGPGMRRTAGGACIRTHARRAASR